MSLGLKVCVAQICEVCKQLMGISSYPSQEELDAMLAGSTDFAVCPCCRGVVPDKMRRSKRYRDRVRSFLDSRNDVGSPTN
jgi:hypothetical protein